jgi:nitrogen fixation protein NifT
MKVMLRHNRAGHLVAYVAKKDLEEEVINQAVSPEGKILTLANGWELAFEDLTDDVQLPHTFEARRLQ